MQNSYDQTPYPSLPYTQSHPDRLATLATLLGLNPAPINRCRVLELGCAGGGNLIPVAYTLPESECVGIDFSPRQIAEGQETVTTLGLTNITLKSMNILDITPELGQFDYIIAHGVYSWAPSEVRGKVLQVCRQHLTPHGVAYISYNAYPGWHMMGIIRDLMLYHTRNMTDPQTKAIQARAILDFLVDSVPTDNEPYANFLKAYASFLKEELKGVTTRGDAFLLHDELEEVNDPVYFHQFIEHAARYNLQYLVEAEFQSVLPTKFPGEVREALQEMASDIVEVEQYMDFLRNRMFRQTLLCHAEIEVNRALKPERITDFYVASRAQPVSDAPDIQAVSVEKFRGHDGATLSIDHPASKAAMLYLAETWPRAVPFKTLLTTARSRLGLETDPASNAEDLNQDAYVLAANLLRAYGYSSQLAEFHAHQPLLTLNLSERPLASPIARLQAQNDSPVVTNLWHERVRLDQFKRYLLSHLDGMHDRPALLSKMTTLAADGLLEVKKNERQIEDKAEIEETLAKGLEQHLHWLARAALLVG